MTTNHPTLFRSRSGFTLVEIMITLVVIAIVAVLASPAFLAMAPEMQLRGAAQDLYSAVQEAKILAIKENRSVGIVIGTTGYTIGEPFEDDNGNGIFDAGDGEAFIDTDSSGDYTDPPHKFVEFAKDYQHEIGLLNTGDLETVVTADWNDKSCGDAQSACNTSGASITFNSRGIPESGDSAFIVNKNKDVCYAITVTTAGSVKLRKYDGATPFNAANWHE